MRGEFADDHRQDDIDRAADGGAEHQEGDLETIRRHGADERKGASAGDDRETGQHATADSARYAFPLQSLGEVASGQDDEGSEDPGQHGEVAAEFLAEAQSCDQV